MASFKITWIVIQFLGWPLTFISMAGEIARLLGIPAQTFELKEPYHTVVSILAIVFLLTMIGRSVVKLLYGVEIWRDKKIANDERVYKIKQSHRNDQ